MPGSILVSVLGVEDLPSPSQPSSSSSMSSHGNFTLKLVLGKVEFQTDGKGDFTFPVLSVRENLRMILYGPDGIEISRSDVKTMEVVEKRSLDSFFPVAGGGQVHLKLQFTLNADELKRVNEMRKAALQKRRLLTLSSDRIADLKGREKVFAELPSQETQQIPTYHSETGSQQFNYLDSQLPDGIFIADMQKQSYTILRKINSQEDENHSMLEEMRSSQENKEVSSSSDDRIDVTEAPSSEEATVPRPKAWKSINSEENFAASTSPQITHDVTESSSLHNGDHQIKVKEPPLSQEIIDLGSVISDEYASVSKFPKTTREITKSSSSRDGDYQTGVKEVPQSEEVIASQPKAVAASMFPKLTQDTTTNFLQGEDHCIQDKEASRSEQVFITRPKAGESAVTKTMDDLTNSKSFCDEDQNTKSNEEIIISQPTASRSIVSEDDTAASRTPSLAQKITKSNSLKGRDRFSEVKMISEDISASISPKISFDKNKSSPLQDGDYQNGVPGLEEAPIPQSKAFNSIIFEEVAASITPETTEEIAKSSSLQGGDDHIQVKQVPLSTEQNILQLKSWEFIISENHTGASISPEVTQEKLNFKEEPQPEEVIIPRSEARSSIVFEEVISASVSPGFTPEMTKSIVFVAGDQHTGIMEVPRSKETIFPRREVQESVTTNDSVSGSLFPKITKEITKSMVNSCPEEAIIPQRKALKSIVSEGHVAASEIKKSSFLLEGDSQSGSKETRLKEAITKSSDSEENISAFKAPKFTMGITKSSSFHVGDQEKSSASNVEKMISAFETIKPQEPKLPYCSLKKTWTRKIEDVNSLRRADHVKVSGMLSKSFSTGSLSDMNSQASSFTNTRPQEQEKYCTVVTGKDNQPNVSEQESYQSYEKQDPAEDKSIKDSYASEVPYSEEKDKSVKGSYTSKFSYCQEKDVSLDTVQTKEVITFLNTVEAQQDSSLVKKVSLEDGESLNENEMVMLDSKGTLDFIEKMIEKVTESEYLNTSDSEEIVPGNPVNKLEDLLVDPRLSVQILVHSDIEEKSMERNFALELFKDNNSDSMFDILAYFDAEHCLLGSHGNRMPRHVCITSGSKQLRDLVGSFQSHF